MANQDEHEGVTSTIHNRSDAHPGECRAAGYVLVCDVFPSFVAENRELIAALLAEGCVLGVGSTGNHDDAVGLYQPVMRQEQH